MNVTIHFPQHRSFTIGSDHLWPATYEVKYISKCWVNIPCRWLFLLYLVSPNISWIISPIPKLLQSPLWNHWTWSLFGLHCSVIRWINEGFWILDLEIIGIGQSSWFLTSRKKTERKPEGKITLGNLSYSHIMELCRKHQKKPWEKLVWKIKSLLSSWQRSITEV